MRNQRILLSIFLLLLLAGGCTPVADRQFPTTLAILPEVKMQNIPITEPLAVPDAEISGMAWYGQEWLILLPQYPGFFTQDNDRGHLFALRKQDILDILDAKRLSPIAPRVIAFVAPGLSQSLAGFEGYEAIDFVGKDAYLTIETKSGQAAKGYLVHAKMADDMSSLTIDTTEPTVIEPQASIRNMSDESLLIAGQSILTFYEVNGETLNANPVAHRFGFDLQPQTPIPFAHIDYRITDVTSLDSRNRFWAINYFFPGDTFLARDDEPLELQYGLGTTHRAYNHVERLVEFQYSEQGITRVDQPPIYLQLSAIQHNWEGLARLDQRGFLLVTDKFPGTILGFVPYTE
ncbi:MAG: hypothetical protein U0175_36770 [Caldilineaceae bacterium]